MTSAPPEGSAAGSVRGERSVALVNAVRSVQARVSSALAAALMIALGLAALTWYYAHALASPARARALAQSRTATSAAGDAPLPSLGRIVPPAAAAERAAPPQPVPQVALPQETPLPESAVSGWSSSASIPTADATHSAAAVTKSAAELARERRLAGGVFARVSGPAGDPTVNTATSSLPTTDSINDTSMLRQAGSYGESSLQTLLKPTVAATVQARLLPDTRFLLPKGAFIDCTLETAIDSTLPGMTTCVTAADTFGADGTVVLLERGSKLVGETRGQAQQGQARIFVVWTEARTPGGVIVPLDSPGTDELGRAGLPGEVERHFWERFGAAMLITVVNGAVQAGVQAANHSGGGVIYAPSTSQDVMTEVLKSTINIPPTVIKHNGDRIQVLVARDLDFRSVYELRTSGTGR